MLREQKVSATAAIYTWNASAPTESCSDYPQYFSAGVVAAESRRIGTS
jgi:hypothetical protein